MRLIIFLPALAICLGTLLIARRLLHYFQLESYQFAGFLKTLNRQMDLSVTPGLVYGGTAFAILFLCGWLSPRTGDHPALYIAASVLLLAAACFVYRAEKSGGREKKPFRLTARVKRLCACLAIVVLLAVAGVWFLFGLAAPGNSYRFVVLSLIPLLLPLWVLLAALLAWPIERLIYELYFRDARKKLMANDRLIRIGITGSYGKTSTKFILREMLSQKYNVLATPDSFNTPMGITSIVRSRLTPAHQVFIAEMGARHPQDIRELCRLVHPTIGVLTSVGPQHLDTFHTLERIKNTKYDLIRALPEDGLAVFANDGGIVTELYGQTAIPKLLTGAPDHDAWAENVTVSAKGSHFTLRLPGHAPIDCVTPLLGKHNIQNIVLAAGLASRLGVSDRQLQAAVAQLKPVQHRLQIVSDYGGITVIDDAYNTNPASSKAALDVLRMFPGRRIIVTPGMVELGAEEERYNREFGEYMADCADIALLIGPRHTAPIRDGLLSRGFEPGSIHSFTALDQAVTFLNTITQPGDVVLYENDLPDSYAEKGATI